MYHKTYLEYLATNAGSWGKKIIDSARTVTRIRPQLCDVGERLAQMERNGIDFMIFLSYGRGARIRTGGLLNPIQTRYQAALRPEVSRDSVKYTSTIHSQEQ